jgi:hypothetical protein
MRFAWRTKLLAARVQRRRTPPPPDREAVVRRHAAGKSFCDIGCMWKVNGRIAFVAEEAGATRVTGVDVLAPTPGYEEEHARRHSQVEFVHGDLHDPAIAERIGRHEVVWCSGVLYHSPNPVLTLQRLRELTGELLILQTTTIPDVPGVAQAAVFYPGLPEKDRELYAGRWGAGGRRGFRSGARGEAPYAPWWWGITPSALDAMLRAADFEPFDRWGDPFGVHVLARPR